MTIKNSKINTTQLCIILLGIFMSMRPILENSMQAQYVGNDCIITCAIAGIVNLLITLLICSVIKKNPGQSFYQILKRLLGSVVTKIVMIMLSIVFVFKLLVVDYQLGDLLYDAVYADINWILFSIPVYLTFLFIAIKCIKTLARCYQIFVPFAVLIFLFTLFISLRNANFENLFPLFSHSYENFAKALSYIMIQSCEFIFLFTFMENIITTEKKYFGKIIFTLSVIFVFIVMFYVLFIAVLGNIAPFIQETLIKMTQFGNVSYGYFKVDAFTTLMWVPVIIIHYALCVYSISYCFNQVFYFNKSITCVIVTILLFLLKFIPEINNKTIMPFFYETIGIFVIGFVLIVPLLLVIAGNLKEKNKNDKNA